jgi:hypothetical protein
MRAKFEVYDKEIRPKINKAREARRMIYGCFDFYK